jgi:DNA-binding LytR/AlgR family response regulator
VTRQEFIDKHKHEIAGFVMDAAVVQRSGAPLAQWLRKQMQAIDMKLALMYDELAVAEQAPAKPQLRKVP